jgi:adenylate cyclase
MSDPFLISLYDKTQLLCEEEFDGSVELGRQHEHEATLYEKKKLSAGHWRWIIARLDEDTVSREHVRVEPLAIPKVRLTNLSKKISIRFQDQETLPAQATTEVTLPCVLVLGRKIARVDWASATDVPLQSLAEATRPPGQPSLAGTNLQTLSLPGSIDVDALLRWLQATVGVLQSASGSADFLNRAARTVVDLVGLHACWIALLDKGVWNPQTVQSARLLGREPRWRPSDNVLRKVKEEKKTFWQTPEQIELHAESLVNVRTVIAAPILDPHGEVIGALYGERRHDAAAVTLPPLTRVEATLVELVAGGVAAGLARLEQEKAALAAQVRFEQFFTPALSRQLIMHPELLQGQDLDVTVLFCDIRAFSRITLHLGPAKTLEWLSDVLDNLSDCALATGGGVVDYVGDEVMAMWGAPERQPDHAQRASKTALNMLARLPLLNERWQAVLGEPFGFGVGINTGFARVGNIGSHHKFKYGPLGNTVNLASRVQGASKYLKANVLVTGATQAQLGPEFLTRRLATVRVVNIDEPVELYEMVPSNQAGWPLLRDRYEEAFREFEAGSFNQAVRVLGNLLTDHPADGPSLVLLSRAVTCLVDGAPPAHPVWTLPGK